MENETWMIYNILPEERLNGYSARVLTYNKSVPGFQDQRYRTVTAIYANDDVVLPTLNSEGKDLLYLHSGSATLNLTNDAGKSGEVVMAPRQLSAYSVGWFGAQTSLKKGSLFLEYGERVYDGRVKELRDLGCDVVSVLAYDIPGFKSAGYMELREYSITAEEIIKHPSNTVLSLLAGQGQVSVGETTTILSASGESTDSPQRMLIPKGIPHTTLFGQDSLVLALFDEEYDPKDDVYYAETPVITEEST